MRIIRNTPDPDQQDLTTPEGDRLAAAVTAAVDAGDWVRKSFTYMAPAEVIRREATATVGQPLALFIALVSYTGPDDDQHRWAVLRRWAARPSWSAPAATPGDQPNEASVLLERLADAWMKPPSAQRLVNVLDDVGYQLLDTDDLDEAIRWYEQLVRAESAHATATATATATGSGGLGDLDRPFDYTDVRGVYGADRSQHDPNVRARLIEAGLLHRRWTAGAEIIDRLGDRRVIAIGRAVRAYGHGGQSALARKLGLKQSTISAACRRADRLCTYTVLVDQLDPANPDARWTQFAAVLSVTDYAMSSPARAALLSVPPELPRMGRSVRVRVWHGSAVDADSVEPAHVLTGTAEEIAALLAERR